MAVTTLDTILRENNPDQLKLWDSWEAKLKPKSFKAKGHRGMYGDFEGYMKAAHGDAYAKAQAMLAEADKKNQPQELPTEDTPVVETRVSDVVTAIKKRRGRTSTILTGMNGDGAAAPMIKRKALLGSYSANG